MTRADLKISFEGNNRCVQGFVCEFRKLVEAMQEGDNVSRKEPKLVWKVLRVEFFQDKWSAYVGWRFGADPFPSRKHVRFYYRFCSGLMRDLAGEKVCCVFTEEPCNLGKAFPKVKGR